MTVRRAVRDPLARWGLDRETLRLPLIEQQFVAHALPAFEREHKFAAPARLWRFDYSWPALRIAFEVEGGTFGRAVTATDGKRYRVGGRHNSGAGLEADYEKYNAAAAAGWCVIRGSTKAIANGSAIAQLVDVFRARGVI